MMQAMQVHKLGEIEVCWQGPGWYRRSRQRPRYYLVSARREASPEDAVWASRPEDLALGGRRVA